VGVMLLLRGMLPRVDVDSLVEHTVGDDIGPSVGLVSTFKHFLNVAKNKLEGSYFQVILTICYAQALLANIRLA